MGSRIKRVSPKRTNVSAPGGALLVFGEPLLEMIDVAAMTTALTPNKESTNIFVANGAMLKRIGIAFLQ